MTRFNKTVQPNKVTNRAGGEAYAMDPKLELATILLTSFVSDQFYRSANETIDEVEALIAKIKDKKFAAKAAVFARNEYGMRSISHVVAGILAGEVKGEEWTKGFYDKVVHRPDDITEILAYYMSQHGKPIPNSLKKGLGAAFGKFDAYQLAKYRGEGKAVSLIDAVNLVRPKPTEKNGEALKQLVAGKLRSADTWETKLSAAGQKAKNEEEKDQLKADAWADLIKSKKIGYFALLRNLRNIIEQAPEVVDEACALLTDEKLIKKSLVLPFRFLTAINEINQISGRDMRKVVVAISKALDISMKNVPELPGRTLVALDVSGSMGGRVAEIAALFAVTLVKSNDADLLTFDTTAQYVGINPLDTTVTLTRSIPFRGGGTSFHTIFETANQAYDRIVILSDMQAWVEADYGYWTSNPKPAFAAYKKRLGCDPKIFSFDLQGQGSLQFPENNVYTMAGFSEKVFDIMKLLETDRKALVNTIEKVEL